MELHFANPDNPVHSCVPCIVQKQASGCTYFAMASPVAKYIFQPIGSQQGDTSPLVFQNYVS